MKAKDESATVVSQLDGSLKICYTAFVMVFERPVAVAYYRVSTDKQGRSGLGLEAQEAAVRAFCAARGLALEAAFTEIESGRRDDRPELAKAFARAKRLRGVLLIAKLDRLARKVHFIAGLIERGVPFAAVDCPDDDAFMLHIRATVAEEEARKISERTKAALAAAKARGVKIGTPGNLTAAAREKAAASNRERFAVQHAALLPKIRAMRDQGKSMRAIAAEIGVSAMTVSRLLAAEESKR